ncbi:hypothetical protein ACEYYH_20475 [Microbacterium trichothecenolyticum]
MSAALSCNRCVGRRRGYLRVQHSVRTVEGRMLRAAASVDQNVSSAQT